jgi:plasmid stabilization system protein ParE
VSEVTWSAKARRAQADIFAYIAEYDPHAALSVCRRIVQAGARLGEYPTGRPGRIPKTYEKSLPDVGYILLYRIDRKRTGDRITVLDIVHGRRNWVPGSWPN